MSRVPRPQPCSLTLQEADPGHWWSCQGRQLVTMGMCDVKTPLVTHYISPTGLNSCEYLAMAAFGIWRRLVLKPRTDGNVVPPVASAPSAPSVSAVRATALVPQGVRSWIEKCCLLNMLYPSLPISTPYVHFVLSESDGPWLHGLRCLPHE